MLICQSPKENKKYVNNTSYLFRLKGTLFRVTEEVHHPHGTRGMLITSVSKPGQREASRPSDEQINH